MKLLNKIIIVSLCILSAETISAETIDYLAIYNWHVNGDSPLINKGDASLLDASIVIDLDGNPRILDNKIDIGAYETLQKDTSSMNINACIISAEKLFYPNPVYDELVHKGNSLTIYTLSGSLVLSTHLPRLNVSSLLEGQYIVKIVRDAINYYSILIKQ